MERMELEGIVGQANHAGKREILVAEEEGGFWRRRRMWIWRNDFHGKRYLLWSKAR